MSFYRPSGFFFFCCFFFFFFFFGGGGVVGGGSLFYFVLIFWERTDVLDVVSLLLHTLYTCMISSCFVHKVIV